MSGIGKLSWLLCGGLSAGVMWYACGLAMLLSVVGIPWARASLVMGSLALMPFGREAVSRGQLTDRDTGSPGLAGNLVWFVLAGLWLALNHLVWALVCALSIVGLPFAVQHFKLARLAAAPVGKTVVTIPVRRIAPGVELVEFAGQARDPWDDL